MIEFSTDNEREALCGFLDVQRAGLIRKLEGVSDVDGRRRTTVSALSLTGLLKHSTIWEQRWFQVVLAGRTLPDGWPDTGRQPISENFEVGDDDTVAHWLGQYEAAIAVSREITAGMELDDRFVRSELADHNLRWLLLHMIEETARHAGHADIIRESLDGTTGM